jgi:hypothetical protein
MPSPKQDRATYATRDQFIASLQSVASIKPSHLTMTDRLGRFRIAGELWHKCDAATRNALLNDAHAHVRSCAKLADAH